MKKVEFIKIRDRLLNGEIPTDWPETEEIGMGLYRTAYRVGNIVVKRYFSHVGLHGRTSDLTIKQKTTLMKTGLIRFSPRVVIGGCWVVEDYYDTNYVHAMSLGTRQKLEHLVPQFNFDLHSRNCGRDKKGRIVFFDY
jgi:hypothetical protein